jgi:hypothetical protein
MPVCVVAFRVATARDVTYRQVMPGALAAAMVWQLLQWFGAVYVVHIVKSASATNSVFALVLGLLAFLYLIATTLLLCAEANVVATDHLYLRALLTPFTRRRRVNGPHRPDCRFPESRFPLAWTYFRESATSDATPRARSSRNTASRQALTVAPQRNCAM